MKHKLFFPKWILVIILMGLCLSSVAAVLTQEKESQEQKQSFKFAVDWNRFRYTDSLTYLEYYAAIPQHLLQFVPDTVGYRAEFLVTATLLQGDSVIASRKQRNLTTIDSLGQLTGTQRLFHVNYLPAKKGEYTLRIEVQDMNKEENVKAYDMPVTIKDYPPDQLVLSDLQLSTNIKRVQVKNPLVKNGFMIYPNPTRLYGIGLPILYSYSEIYNLAPATSDSGNYYVVTYHIFNTDGVQVKSFKPKMHKKPGTSAVEVNGVNVVTLVSGPYFIVMEVEDKETGAKVATQQKFFVYRKEDYAEGGAAFKKQEALAGKGSPGLDADRYDVMEEKEIDKEFEFCRYIATKDERKTFKKLNLEGKRKFIKEFWAKRDQTPGTAINEFKRQYLAMVQYANQAFRGNFREGWRTDRGRVLLIYGKPDEVERFPFNTEHKAYEIWHFFQIQGGVDFVFVDRRDMGDYELVHSTARGELYDPDWTRWIQPGR